MAVQALATKTSLLNKSLREARQAEVIVAVAARVEFRRERPSVAPSAAAGGRFGARAAR